MTASTEKAPVIVKGLLKIGSDLHRLGNSITGKYGLNQQQFVVLSEIISRSPINQKQLVGGLVIEKSNLSKIVKKLNTIGLIRITSSQEDGRTTLLSPTKKGKTIWEECMEEFVDWQVDWASPLSNEELSQTIRVTERSKRPPLSTT